MNNRSIFAKFVAELRRRDVIRIGVTYIGVSWLLLQVLDVASQMLIVDVIVGTFTFIFLMCLFPVVLYVSWHFQFTGKGWIRTAESDVDSDGNVIPPGKPGWGSWLGEDTALPREVLVTERAKLAASSKFEFDAPMTAEKVYLSMHGT